MMLRFKTLASFSNFSLFAIGVMVACESVAQSQHVPEIEVRADRDAVQILDPFEVEIEVIASETSDVQLPAVGKRFGPFEVLDHRDVLRFPLEGESGKCKWLRRLTLETMETGELEIPSIEVFVRDTVGSESKSAATTPTRLMTKPVVIKVATVLEVASDPSKFNDIRNVIDAHEPETADGKLIRWVVWSAGGGLALFALAAASMVLVRRKRWTTPAAWAKGEIAMLSTDSSGAIEGLENVLRQFIETEFGFPATAQTSDQLQQQLIGVGASSDCVSSVTEFISKASEAKFAGLRLSDRDVDDAKATVLAIIEQLDSIPSEAN